jgi:hypothetical protein
MKTSLILALFSVTFSMQAQQPCACCTPEHRQFDFWLGKWDAFNPAGKKVGENTITQVQGNCVLLENWVSTGTGTSYNYYDPTDSTWNQLYLDNQGTILKLKGKFEVNKMILWSDEVKGQNGNYRNRITWQQLPDGHVSQKWDIVALNGTVLSVAFDGVYKKKN